MSKNTIMGEIREKIAKEKTSSLAKRYGNMNYEGRKATYDELRKRKETKLANFLRYGKLKKPMRQRVEERLSNKKNPFGLPNFNQLMRM